MKPSRIILVLLVAVFALLVFSALFDHWIFYDYYVAKAARLTGINTYLLKAVGIVFFVPLVLGIRMAFNPLNSTTRRNGYVLAVTVIAVYNLTFFFLTRNQNFAFSDGKGLRWYSIRDGSVIYFDRGGIDPVTGIPLRGVTTENASTVLRWEHGEINRANPPLDGPFFGTRTTEPLYWIHRSDADIEFYDGPGFHPITREPLQELTPAIIEEWRKRQRDKTSVSLSNGVVNFPRFKRTPSAALLIEPNGMSGSPIIRNAADNRILAVRNPTTAYEQGGYLKDILISADNNCVAYRTGGSSMGDIILVLRRTEEDGFYCLPSFTSRDEPALYGPQYPKDYIRRRQIPKALEENALIYEDRFTIQDPRWREYAYQVATVAMNIDTMKLKVLKWNLEPPRASAETSNHALPR